MQAQQQTAAAKPKLLDDWLSRHELAAQLGVSASTLARWETARTGPPSVRIGQKIFYRREAVRKWLEERERKGPPKAGHRQRGRR